MITELEFKSLAAQGYNRIPLLTEAFADLETPLSLYLKLAHTAGVSGAPAGGGRYSFLLESVVGGERFGRYSFIGLPARTLLRTTGWKTEVVTDGVVVESHDGNPLDFIAAYQQRFKVALRPGLPRFCGGLAGYFGYDAVRYIEPRLAKVHKAGGIATPDVMLLQCEELAVIDKRRTAPNVAEVMNLIGEVRGKVAIILDDMIDTAGTLTQAAMALKEHGARTIYACATHVVLSGPAIERINSSVIEKVVLTDTIPVGEKGNLSNKLVVLSVAGLLAEAIRRIHEDESVSSLFV